MGQINPDRFSSTLLNAIRDAATDDYKERVPEATAQNLAEVGSAILNFDYTRNQFQNALFNQVVLSDIVGRSYENHLKMFKDGDMPFGESMQEIYVPLIKSTSYDPKVAESEVFKRNMPQILTVFHNVNRKNQYKVTIMRDWLKMAFQSEGGMMQLVNKIIGRLPDSDNNDEFLYMKSLIKNTALAGRMATVTVPPATDKQSVEDIVVAIKETASKMTFMNKNYSYANVEDHVPYDELVLFVSPAFKARYDVALLAQAFNKSDVEFNQMVVEIDDFGGVDAVCALVEKRWMIVRDNLIDTEEFQVPGGRYTNYWYYHWQLLSTSPFAKAVLFVPATPTVTAVDVLPATATVRRGDSLQLNVEVTGTNNPTSKCDWEQDGEGEFTSITTLGYLVVDNDEPLDEITVTATSTVNPLISDTAVITIID